jgi:2-dehydro-3-deoxygalactonokinase
VSATALIGVDWGTSQLRAYRISSAGQALERRESAQGIAVLRQAQFDQALSTLIADWQPEPGAIPILMCGMIGSRQGWREVPYRPCPASPADLLDTLQPIDTSCGRAFVVGGLSTADERGCRDIMRGEETQIFGAVASTAQALAIAPGTHSKWAEVDGASIRSFRTYMTGEVYGLLRKHSSLGWLMGKDDDDTRQHDQPFLSGVHQALEDPELLHALFGVRTRGLLEPQAPGALAAYLSGLLIGSEIAGATRHYAASPILIIAAPTLASLYRTALTAARIADVVIVDASEALVRGLWQLWQLRGRA